MKEGLASGNGAARKREADVPSEDDEFERAFGWLQNDVYRQLLRSWDRQLRASGVPLSRQQARVISELIRSEGMTQTELAEEVEADRAPLGRLLDRMEEAALVERKPDPKDRRVRRVYVTAYALTFKPHLHAAAKQLFERALSSFSDAEVDTLIALQQKLLANLLEMESEPMPETPEAPAGRPDFSRLSL